MPKTKTPDPVPDDLARLEKAIFLRSRRLGPGQYEVEGSVGNHDVDVRDRAYPACDCPDFVIRRGRCKHILAALLREDDREAREDLRRLVTCLRAAA